MIAKALWSGKAVFAVILVLLVAACAPPGGGEEAETTSTPIAAAPEDGEPDTTEAADDEPAGEAIKVGVIMPLTGTVAANGQDAVDGWNLYWEVNGNTVAGREIQTFVEDTAGDPATALQKVEQLVGSTEVDMIVGPLLANVGLAVADRLAREDVPHFSPTMSADDLTQRNTLDTFVRIGGWTSSQTSHPLGQWAWDQGFRSVATSCTDYAFGHEMCGGFVNVFTENGGEIVDQLWNPIGTQDFATYATQMQQLDVDAAFILQVGADTQRFLQAWQQFGLKDQVELLGGEVLLDQSALRNMGDEALDLVSAGHWAEGRDAPETQEFVSLYEEAYGQIPSYYSAGTFTAAQWIATAIEQLDGDISDQAAFMDTIRSLELEETPFGPQKLDEFGNPVFNVYIRKVEQRDDGRLWNVVIDTVEDVSQFWTFDPEEYLQQPVYSREFQGGSG